MKNIFLMVLLIAQLFLIVNCYAQTSINKSEINSISFALNERWPDVMVVLDTIPENDPNSSILKLVKGHAALALNENNLSFCYFLDVMYDSTGLQKWLRFAEQLVADHPKSSVAYYFLGDAYARTANWLPEIERNQAFHAAIDNFSEAIKLDKENYLAYNSRGVTKLMVQNYRGKFDFDDALKIKQDFSDALSNLGSRTLEMKDLAQSGINYFDSALNINPDFSLAYFSKGCLNVVLSGEISSEFDIALGQTFCFNPFFVVNFDSLIIRVFGTDDFLLSELISNPGMSIDVKYKQTEQAKANHNLSVNNLVNKVMSGSATQGDFNKVVNTLNQLDAPSRREALERWSGIVQNPKFQPVAQFVDKAAPTAVNWSRNQSEQMRATANVFMKTSLPIVGIMKGGPTGRAAGKIVSDGYAETINKNWEYTNQQSITGANDLHRNVPRQKPGGVYINLSNSIIDSGAWPFIPCYGLIYNFFIIR